MNKKKSRDMSLVIYIVGVICFTILLWLIGNFFAKTVSDHEIIRPSEGIKCVVVSRMFNTSVDCWKEIKTPLADQ